LVWGLIVLLLLLLLLCCCCCCSLLRSPSEPNDLAAWKGLNLHAFASPFATITIKAGSKPTTLGTADTAFCAAAISRSARLISEYQPEAPQHNAATSAAQPVAVNGSEQTGANSGAPVGQVDSNSSSSLTEVTLQQQGLGRDAAAAGSGAGNAYVGPIVSRLRTTSAESVRLCLTAASNRSNSNSSDGGSRSASSATLLASDCNRSCSLQDWEFTADGSVKVARTSLCMTGFQQPGLFGVEVARCRAPATPSQQWFYDRFGQLRTYAAPWLCVDVEPGAPAEGGVVQLTPCFNAFGSQEALDLDAAPNPSQTFNTNVSAVVASFSQLVPSLGPDSNISFGAVSNMSFGQLCLDAAGFVPGAPALLQECRTRAHLIDPDQLWNNGRFNTLHVLFGNGVVSSYHSACLAAGSMAEANDSSAAVGSNVTMQECTGLRHQQWFFDGYSRLRPFAAADTCVGVLLGTQAQLLLQLAGCGEATVLHWAVHNVQG
jgi:hypothetical protein